MASLNVAEWSPDQVADWLSGLGPTVARYGPALRARGLDGAKLLMLRCDDLEYLGMHIIGHQELLLEAVEHLRNFQYESRRECVQQLAARVSGAATGLARALARALRRAPDARLDTQALADVAATVRAVKPLVCWLDRWPLMGGVGAGARGAALGVLAERRAQLLQLSLEAATCAQRDRFAEQPARAVAAAAAAAAQAADYIVQEVSDPMILQPGSLDAVTLRQGGKPLGFDVVPSFCGHHQLADIRFGSPAHASGIVHDADEIVQVGGQCVVGWSGGAVLRLCGRVARAGGELPLRLRRRAAATPMLHRARPAPPAPLLPVDHERDSISSTVRSIRPTEKSPPAESFTRAVAAADAEAGAEAGAEADADAGASSDDSEPLSPPASPDHLHLVHTRLYPPKPRSAVQRRHTVSGGSPVSKRPNITIDQFWRQLREHKWDRGDSSDHDDSTLYRRDKAVSYSTGLELSPRPRTCMGALLATAATGATGATAATAATGGGTRGRLDKSQSTPAYDLGGAAPGALVTQVIPESPTRAHAAPSPAATPAATPSDTPADSPTILVHSAEKADQILDFKKSSSAIASALQLARRDPEPAEPGPEPRARDHLETDKERILETINIAMMERRRSLLERDERDLSDDDQRTPLRLSVCARAPEPPPRPGGGGGAGTARAAGAGTFPVLRAVAREAREARAQPLRPAKPLHASQISLPLRHITKHDIKMIPHERRELPAINADADAPDPPRPARGPGAPAPPAPVAHAPHAPHDLSPTAPAHAKSIFSTSKSRSLKKKNSILAKRRCVAARALSAGAAVASATAGAGAGAGADAVWQRVRPRHAQTPRWARRHLLLAHDTLYAYRTMDCNKADCMIYLEGFTVCAAGEVKSRANAFKVYHTGTAFYFACDTPELMQAWISLIHRATMHSSAVAQADISKQFSETDYSDTESDTDSPEKRSRSRDRQLLRRESDKDKDKSKFGSLKKLTARVPRSESSESVHAAASLDRKYLRFFSRGKPKDDAKNAKNKQSGVPVPTEHYRSYRRVPAPLASPPPASPAAPASPAPAPLAPAAPAAKIPKPINYIHASNPNLLDFEKSGFVARPPLRAPRPSAKLEPAGLVTLEEFMLNKQAEERRQVYTNRVLLGVERGRPARDLQRRLDRIVPDVIYGELPAAMQGRELPRTPPQPAAPAPDARAAVKPISVKGKDGYEKLVYPAETGVGAGEAGPGDEREPAHERRRDSLRRNDRVHSAADAWPAGAAGAAGAAGGANAAGGSRLRVVLRGAGGAGGAGAGAGWAVYPHLQCPPTFQPETYSLARLAPSPAPPRPDPAHRPA